MTQQPMSSTLAQDLTVRCVDAGSTYVDLRAAFAFDPADPYAVWVTVPW